MCNHTGSALLPPLFHLLLLLLHGLLLLLHGAHQHPSALHACAAAHAAIAQRCRWLGLTRMGLLLVRGTHPAQA
jgi:hypothetical protein